MVPRGKSDSSGCQEVRKTAAKKPAPDEVMETSPHQNPIAETRGNSTRQGTSISVSQGSTVIQPVLSSFRKPKPSQSPNSDRIPSITSGPTCRRGAFLSLNFTRKLFNPFYQSSMTPSLLLILPPNPPSGLHSTTFTSHPECSRLLASSLQMRVSMSSAMARWCSCP